MPSKSQRRKKSTSKAVFNTATAVFDSGKHQLPKKNLYIRNVRLDFLLIILSPLFIMGAAYLSELAGMLTLLAFFAHTIGTAGHHLPGMLRAYGDKELFEQFKVRFILVPTVLLPLCIYFAFTEYKGLSAVLLLWGMWHGMAQAYGFARIYDSKMGRFSKSFAKLDLALYASWFLVGFVCSDNRIVDALGVFYQIGFPLFQSEFVLLAQKILLSTAVVISLIYIVNEVKIFSRGEKNNWTKHALTISSCGFWCYAMISVKTAIVSLALFELFHDIQYLAIVWFFNQNRISQKSNVGNFTKKLFGSKPYHLILYIGVVLLYGSVALLQYRVNNDIVIRLIVGFFVFSTILHFYFDGFIWKLRKASISKSLDITSASSGSTVSRHQYKWLVGAGIILGLGILQTNTTSDTTRNNSIAKHFVEIAPYNADALHSYGKVLSQKGENADALRYFMRANAINSENIGFLESTAQTLEKLGQPKEARNYYEKIITLDPRHEKAHLALIRLKSLIDFGVPLQFIDP